VSADDDTRTSRRDRSLALVFKLRGVPLFKGLSADELLPVAEIATEAAYEPGDTIFEQGAQGEHLYVISSGSVEILHGGERIAKLGAGECFGEMALLDRTTRSATVRALEDTKLVATAREDFNDLLELYPALARTIANVLVARLRESNRGASE